MKKVLLIAITGFISLGACKKGETLQIDESNLTQCEDNAECSFSYFLNKDLEGHDVKEGKLRLFTFENTWASGCGIVDRIYVKVPMNTNSFYLKNEDIQKGKIIYVSICPCCLQVPLEITAGYVKGKSLTKDINGKWILDMEIKMANKESSQVIKTIRIKQYFNPITN
ncbi:hypothetical protein Pedsa_3800 [Pseudopedobacter saltans DSM 12145]|uniref:Lipoprotein n=1 Tax=Pseudopedobacter saltans (strain ATCC 51119 / DSM 12145 / JCM 21818 / CCUG 39354 / LMG 10337 / NBRC 100064 / NCIMB 13643) TaxID=762903 RepID=F0S756_PSESL|nr:hypothetical protein [Pseudopedobacter saltans]ADY54329.1 hypothetical protein Pedsa_3800 [Pseudopedobacter saltans DSM 12145]